MKLFIDGQHGAAGVCLVEKLKQISNYSLIKLIQIEDLKNEEQRYNAIKSSDVSVLCLPEDISAKTCYDFKNCDTTIIDASTHHRILPGWTYAYPELNKHQIDKIINSKRIANPGCFANGILSILNPLKNFINQDIPLVLQGVTGYSAGGNKTIKKQEVNPLQFRSTNLSREHIHLIEVKHHLELNMPIAFMPNVSSFKQGQMVSCVLFQQNLTILLNDIYLHFCDFYKHFNSTKVFNSEISSLIPEQFCGRNDMEIYITKPSDNYIQISSIYDNLGKGSAGSISTIISQLLKSNKY